MYVLLFCFWGSVVLAFVLVLRVVCITNAWDYTEIFPVLPLKNSTVPDFCSLRISLVGFIPPK